jgi:hypothetical protein
MSSDLHKLLVKSAAKRQQSINAEINFLLIQALKGEGITDRAERSVHKLQAVMAEADKTIARLEKATDEFGTARAEHEKDTTK